MIKLFRRIKLIKLEVIATVAWFLSDFLWMWDQIIPAICIFPFIAISMLISIIRIKSKNLKRVLLITLMWLMMNSIWMLSDLSNDIIAVKFIKIIASAFGIIGFAQLILFFITKPKTIQNFKRFLNVNNEA